MKVKFFTKKDHETDLLAKEINDWITEQGHKIINVKICPPSMGGTFDTVVVVMILYEDNILPTEPKK